MNICANVKYISVQDTIKSVGVSRGVSSVYLSGVCANFLRTSVQFPSVFICASHENVFPYKEVFHLSACHQQTTVESGKPLGRMPEKLICIARWTTCKFKFFNLDKCISLSRQIHFAIQNNSFCNLDKYIFVIWANTVLDGSLLHSTMDNF